MCERERERRREVQLKRDSLLQVLQGHYLVAFGLLSVAAVSDVVGGLATSPTPLVHTLQSLFYNRAPNNNM